MKKTTPASVSPAARPTRGSGLGGDIDMSTGAEDRAGELEDEAQPGGVVDDTRERVVDRRQ